MRGVRSAVSAPENSSKLLIALEEKAHGVVARLPELLMEANRIAATVAHGIHGRRRAGPGETFWQFRQYEQSDPAALIDWRRTASSTHVYVREREWEAAHTVYLWLDLSRSMDFSSHLSPTTKRDRAIVLLLAACEMLVQGGERVALLGLTKPSANRKTMSRVAENLAAHATFPLYIKGLPPRTVLPRFSTTLLVSDFLNPPADIIDRMNALASSGVEGHLIQVLDPAEETLPYEGRTEFISPSGRERWVADRAESLRKDYKERLNRHRGAITEAARKVGWSFIVHHTDRPATEPLLALIARLSKGMEGGAATPRSPSALTPASASGSTGQDDATTTSAGRFETPAGTGV